MTATITIEPTLMSVYRTRDLDTAKQALDQSHTITNLGGTVWITAAAGVPDLEVAEPACYLINITNTTDFPIELSDITRILGEHGVGIIPTSSYGGDYLLVKDAHINSAAAVLSDHGYDITDRRQN